MSENKPVIRGITINGPLLLKKIEVLSKLYCGDLAVSELNTLAAIITYSNNNSLFISPIISRQLQKSFNITPSAFSTSLFRLSQKGLIKKDSKTVTLNPIFTGVMEMDRLLVSFVED
ncbi:MAG: hypothetical protein WC055_01890 [Melioribacteraceae bacterium]